MKKFLLLICFYTVNICIGQQTIMYTQYTFNKAGLNPAASGTDINQKFYYVFGVNRQWLTFDNAPKSNFINFSYTLRPPRAYRFWQNIGIYADSEESGLMQNGGVYLNYTIHTLLRKKNVLSFGIYAGARRFVRDIFSFDQNDPAVQNNRSSLILYPDLIPGIRLSNKKYFLGLSVRNLTITKLENPKGKIGSPSKLSPSVYFEYGKTIEISDRLVMMPSMAVNAPIVGPPLFDFTLMYYFANRIGGGLAIRNASFASAILQIRFLKTMTAGFAYSYPLNKTRFAAQHSYEFMLGITPFGMNTRMISVHEIVRCPALTY